MRNIDVVIDVIRTQKRVRILLPVLKFSIMT